MSCGGSKFTVDGVLNSEYDWEEYEYVLTYVFCQRARIRVLVVLECVLDSVPRHCYWTV